MEETIQQVEVINQLSLPDLYTVTDKFANEIMTATDSFAVIKTLTYGDMLIASLLFVLVALKIAKLILDIIK